MTNASQKEALSKNLKELRRPYEKPRIMYSEPLEAVAAFCDPTDPPPFNGKATPGVCGQGSS